VLEVRRADRRLKVAIVCCLVGGPLFTLWSLWLAFQPWMHRKDRAFGGVFLGLFIFSLGLYELKHRLRHGPQQAGRRVKPRDD
jgi:polyferredoxin